MTRRGSSRGTPAIQQAERARIEHSVHSYEAEFGPGYGEQAAAALGVEPERVFKTLLAKLDGSRLVVAIVPVTGELDLKRLAAAAGAKKAAMAAPAEAERATGYVIGGISPLGQRQRHPTFLDRSALGFETVHVSAGRRGLEIELAPSDLADLCDARVAELSRSG